MKYSIIVLVTTLLFGCSDGRIKPSKEDLVAFRQILEQALSEQKSSHSINYPEGENWEYIIESEKIFDAFWNPKNLKQYGELEDLSRDRYKKDEYLIVQTEYIFAIPEPQEWIESNYNLYSNFRRPSKYRPPVQCTIYTNANFMSKVEITDCKVLHLTPQLESEINNFLGADFTEYGTPSLMSPAQANEMSAKRLAAANKFSTIVPGHWGEQWHCISHPEVEAILINPDRDQALVLFRIGYEGGFTVMKKKSDNWIIVESIVDWIE